MELKNKTILIISPNNWGKMKISKHHYAIELAKRKNLVFFLNPPNNSKKYFEKQKIQDNLYVIDYKSIFRGQRFLPTWLFHFLVSLQIIFLQKKIKQEIDVLWSFSSNIYFDLKKFDAKLRIFFPADQITRKEEIDIAKNADFVFTVSEVILRTLKHYINKSFFINHGLSDIYKEFVKNSIFKKYDNSKKVNCCFIGNLLVKSLDIDIFKQIIIENKNMNFIFYGAYELSQSNLSGYKSKDLDDFVEFLKEMPNVTLKGSCEPSQIVLEISKFDIFLCITDIDKDDNKGSNAHKILEYLSTGKVLVSNYMSTYENNRDIIEMVDELHNKKFPDLFKKVSNNLDKYNSKELWEKLLFM